MEVRPLSEYSVSMVPVFCHIGDHWSVSVLGIQTRCTATSWKHQMARGSHFYVPCRSICNWDQNWIKWPKPFWGTDQGIKVTSKLLKINNQEHGCNLTFDLWKSSDQEPQEGWSSNQAHFLPIKSLIVVANAIKRSRASGGLIKQSSTLFADQKLDRGCKCFNRRHISGYPWRGSSWSEAFFIEPSHRFLHAHCDCMMFLSGVARMSKLRGP